MTSPPLAIVQARVGSRRFHGKVLKDVAGEPLVVRVWRLASLAVGRESAVVAYPATDENLLLREVLDRHNIPAFAWDGPEVDVLGRFYACAHRYRWHPDTVILRVTADDPWKDPVLMRRVIAGERLPVEQGGEAFTLAMLDAAYLSSSLPTEHIGRHEMLFPTPPPKPPASPVPWSIDSEADYWAVVDAITHDWPEKK